jgi:hypothetical protein
MTYTVQNKIDGKNFLENGLMEDQQANGRKRVTQEQY